MDQRFLYSVRPGRELADGEVERTVDDIFGRPLRGRIWPLVEEGADARGKAEHRQDPSIGEPLAEMILGEMLVPHRLVDLGD